MTTVRSALEPYFAPVNPYSPTGMWGSPEAQTKYERYILGASLVGFMNGLARQDDGWAVFNHDWRRWAGVHPSDINRPIHASTLVSFCEDYMGCPTLESVSEWVGFMRQAWAGKAANLNKNTDDLVLDYDAMPVVSFTEIMELVRQSGYVASWLETVQTDNEYRLFSASDVQKIKQKCPSARLSWLAERRDCDDHARIAKAWLSTLGYGNCTLFETHVQLLAADDAVLGSHAIDLITWEDVDGSRKVEFFEPQTNNTYKLTETWIGAGINGTPTKNLIYWVEA